jgi:hypothetical protein
MIMFRFAEKNDSRLVSSSSSPQSSFVVGRDQRGAWIALETHGLAGGIFVTRDAARRYAEFETDRRPGAVSFAARPLDLTF